MKKKKIVIPENYLEKIPVKTSSIDWSTDDKGIVTLKIENTGWANRLAQFILFRPKFSYVHLDKNGSFVWPLIDGKKSITEIGKLVDAEFGEEAHPLYERLAQFFRVLDSYHFIHWTETNKKK